MKLKYDIYKLRNAEGNGKDRPYVRVIQHEPMNEQQLKATIQERCSLTKGDVAAVLEEFRDLFIRELSEGRRFYLPGIGYFSLSVSLQKTDASDADNDNSEEMATANQDDTTDAGGTRKKKITGHDVRLTGINFKPEANLVDTVGRNVHFIRSRYSRQSTAYTEKTLFNKITDYLQQHRSINAHVLRFQFGLTQYMTQKWLRHFVDKGLLVKDGSPQSPVYYMGDVE